MNTESISRAGRRVVGFGLGDAPACAALPSGPPAVDLLSGNIRALPAVLGTTVARAALIGAGLFVAGERARGRLAKHAAAGSLAVEAFVLAWAAWKRQQGSSP
jgi:hypothetical protein